MPRTIALLLLATLLAACGDDDPDVADISEMRVVKVSGDQEAPVQAPETQASITPTRIVLQAGGGNPFTSGYTPEPLVARVVSDGAGTAQSMLTGPISAAVVPSGTLVHWQLEPECGKLFAVTTATDDSAFTINRWGPGIKAGVCHAAAGRLVGAEIVIDATWELEVLPGPPVFLGSKLPLNNLVLTAGQTINLDSIARARGIDAYDRYSNVIHADILLTYPITWSIVGPMENYSLDCFAWPVIQQGSGWGSFVVPPASEWPYCFLTHYDGQFLGGQLFRSQPAS